MSGFFSESVLKTKAPISTLLPKCGACQLYQKCTTPKMPYSGNGKKRILIVGEFPSEWDDDEGTHFKGSAGKLLEDTLADNGIDMREDCWLTNALICTTSDYKGATLKKQAEYCRPNLVNTVQTLNPDVVILLGYAAVAGMIGWTWKEDPGSLNRWVGWVIPSQKPNMWICPTYHPSQILREQHSEVTEMAFEKHIAAAVAKVDKPWKVLPNYSSQVEVILDPDVAAKAIREIMADGGLTAFDYENNCLKPEYEGARIVCASICLKGVRTIAYPWIGEAIVATGEYLAYDQKKIAANMKHEDRWSRWQFHRRVRGWYFDTMLAAHTIDNREGGVCGLKFQAYVLLGAESYNDHISPFLQTAEGTHLNRVHEIQIKQLCKYCGMDTLLEYKVAMKQIRQLENKV